MASPATSAASSSAWNTTSNPSPLAGHRCSARVARPGGLRRYSPCMTRSTQLAAALAAAILAGCGVNHSEGPPPPPVPLDPAVAAAFLDTVEARTFHYFWDLTNTSN